MDYRKNQRAPLLHYDYERAAGPPIPAWLRRLNTATHVVAVPVLLASRCEALDPRVGWVGVAVVVFLRLGLALVEVRRKRWRRARPEYRAVGH